MTKKCSKCELIKDISEFYRRKKYRSGEYYGRCKDCFKGRGRKYYYDNHERQLELANIRKSRYREERVIWLEEIKDKPCMDCGIKYPSYVMDFDHKEGHIKIASISWLALHNTSSFDKIKAEIEKCDLICANCHRVRTHIRLQKTKFAAVAKVVKADV